MESRWPRRGDAPPGPSALASSIGERPRRAVASSGPHHSHVRDVRREPGSACAVHALQTPATHRSSLRASGAPRPQRLSGPSARARHSCGRRVGAGRSLSPVSLAPAEGPAAASSPWEEQLRWAGASWGRARSVQNVAAVRPPLVRLVCGVWRTPRRAPLLTERSPKAAEPPLLCEDRPSPLCTRLLQRGALSRDHRPRALDQRRAR